MSTWHPYLIVDDSMLGAHACRKERRGCADCDPRHPDKNWCMWRLAYYRDLIEAGVRIYEYSMGSMHSKIFVADDTTAAVGTTILISAACICTLNAASCHGCDTVK